MYLTYSKKLTGVQLSISIWRILYGDP